MADAIPTDDQGALDQIARRGWVQPQAPPIPLPAARPVPQMKIGNSEIQPPATTAPIVGPAADSQNDPDQAAVNAYNAHPISATAPIRSGVASLWAREGNIHNPILRTAAKVGTGILGGLETVGDIVAPRVTAAIPGTRLNKEIESKREANAGKEAADTAHTEAETAHTGAETQALEHPAVKQESEGKTVTTDEGVFQWDPKTETYGIRVGAAPDKDKGEGKTVTTDKGVMQWNPDSKRYDIPVGNAPEKKPDSIDQQYQQAIAAGDVDTAHRLLKIKGDLAAAGQAPQRDQRQLAVRPDGKVIELKPGVTVPQGTKTVSGDLATGKPTADEQRRADLAENLNENFDQLEDILSRRPDLFGKVAGRLTNIREWIGSDDKDIAALGTLKHQIGMAQISAHGMRSAQGVESAAESLVNSWKNGPEATKAAIEKARTSVKTFSGDVERAKAGKGNGGPPAGNAGMVWDPVKGQYIAGH